MSSGVLFWRARYIGFVVNAGAEESMIFSNALLSLNAPILSKHTEKSVLANSFFEDCFRLRDERGWCHDE